MSFETSAAPSQKRRKISPCIMKLVNRLSTPSKIRSSLIDPPQASSAKKNAKYSHEASPMLRTETLQRLLTTEDVAVLLGIAPATIVFWRSQRRGPPFVRLGRGRRAPIRYRLDAVEAYIAEMENTTL